MVCGSMVFLSPCAFQKAIASGAQVKWGSWRGLKQPSIFSPPTKSSLCTACSSPSPLLPFHVQSDETFVMDCSASEYHSSQVATLNKSQLHPTKGQSAPRSLHRVQSALSVPSPRTTWAQPSSFNTTENGMCHLYWKPKQLHYHSHHYLVLQSTLHMCLSHCSYDERISSFRQHLFLITYIYVFLPQSLELADKI